MIRSVKIWVTLGVAMVPFMAFDVLTGFRFSRPILLFWMAYTGIGGLGAVIAIWRMK